MKKCGKYVIAVLILFIVVGCSNTQNYAQLVGTFEEQQDYPAFMAYVTLYENGTCDFHVNYLEGTCKTEGTFTINGNKLTLNLTRSDPDGFLGEKYLEGTPAHLVIEQHIATEQYFTILNNDTLQINDGVYNTPKNSLFVRQDVNVSSIK